MIEYARVDLPTGVRTSIETVILQSGVGVQVCRTSVHPANAPAHQVTLLFDELGSPLPTQTDLSSLAGSLADSGILAGMQSARSGEAAVVTRPEFESAAESIALAAAVCAASWGWDESEYIRVRVNDQEWEVVAEFREGAWMARIGR